MRNIHKLSIVLLIFTSFMIGCTNSPIAPHPQGSRLTDQQIESYELLDFYLADIYSDTANFVKFTPILISEKFGKKFSITFPQTTNTENV